MSDFTPGVERAKKAGYTIDVKPYPLGDAGIALSLDTVAKKVRDGRLDPDVRGWAGDVLIAAGKPTRVREQAQALLDAFRRETMYVSDPVGAEYIVAAKDTVCLRPGLCVRARDCFPEGTKLLRDDFALVPIEDIKVGDRIWGKDKWTEVKAKWSKGELPVDALVLNNGSTVCLTGDHKVYRAGQLDEWERVLVSELREEDTLLRPDDMLSAGMLDRMRIVRRDRVLLVTRLVRGAKVAPCWDITTEDHYVYLPEHDVTVSNCDDGVVCMGAALLSIGIPVLVIKQTFGADQQQHVLLACQDEQGSWLAVDPSTSLPVGQRVPAESELIIDPMDVTGSHGTSGAEIVTVGAVPHKPRDMSYIGGVLREKRYGRQFAWTGAGWVEELPSKPRAGAGDACCAACAKGLPCASSLSGGPDDQGEPCSACELYASRMGVGGVKIGPITLVKGLGQSPPGVGFGTVILTGVAVALAGGVAWGLASRAATRSRAA